MTIEQKTSARAVAATVLNQFDAEKSLAAPILEKAIAATEQRQRATDLLYTSLRNRSAIDVCIAKLADCPIARINRKLLSILRVAACELIYNPQTPEYSIVNEAVESAKRNAGKKQTAFVNAVLRQITRRIKNRQAPLAEADPKKILPQSISHGCLFDTDLLPDPQSEPAEHLSAAFSLPNWLVMQWLEDFGSDQTRRICFASNRKPSLYIRPNRLKITPQDLLEKFLASDIDAAIVEESMITIKSPKAVTSLPGFTNGLFTIQDMTAAKAVKLLAPQPAWTILDLCSAPGTKTTQLAELTADSAHIFATDIDTDRLEKVAENKKRLHLNSITIFQYPDLEKTAAKIGLFDAVLLDVPCSNTGVLAKRPEVRFRVTKKAVTKLTETQLTLLEKAAALIKPNGLLLYSTCSIQPNENEKLIEKFTETAPFELQSQFLTVPCAQTPDHDGGYAALLKKI